MLFITETWINQCHVRIIILMNSLTLLVSENRVIYGQVRFVLLKSLAFLIAENGVENGDSRFLL